MFLYISLLQPSYPFNLFFPQPYFLLYASVTFSVLSSIYSLLLSLFNHSCVPLSLLLNLLIPLFFSLSFSSCLHPSPVVYVSLSEYNAILRCSFSSLQVSHSPSLLQSYIYVLVDPFIPSLNSRALSLFSLFQASLSASLSFSLSSQLIVCSPPFHSPVLSVLPSLSPSSSYILFLLIYGRRPYKRWRLSV